MVCEYGCICSVHVSDENQNKYKYIMSLLEYDRTPAPLSTAVERGTAVCAGTAVLLYSSTVRPYLVSVLYGTMTVPSPQVSVFYYISLDGAMHVSRFLRLRMRPISTYAKVMGQKIIL